MAFRPYRTKADRISRATVNDRPMSHRRHRPEVFRTDGVQVDRRRRCPSTISLIGLVMKSLAPHLIRHRSGRFIVQPGHDKNRCSFATGQATDLSADRKTIHSGHEYIQQDERGSRPLKQVSLLPHLAIQTPSCRVSMRISGSSSAIRTTERGSICGMVALTLRYVMSM